MLFLSTGRATAKVDEWDRVIISVPNGDGAPVEIALSFHEAMALSVVTKRTVADGLDTVRLATPPSGEIIAFTRRSVA
jgi:hypothetical protein